MSHQDTRETASEAPGPQPADGAEGLGAGATEPAAQQPEPGYAECMAELELILSELEGGDPDVDMLAARVERAAGLIEICRRRITNASIQVERLVAALDSSEAA